MWTIDKAHGADNDSKCETKRLYTSNQAYRNLKQTRPCLLNVDYEIIIGTPEATGEKLAIVEATRILQEHLPEASVWRVNVYDCGAGVGVNVETEEEVRVEQCDDFETVQELGTAE